MKRKILFLLTIVVQMGAFSQEYFPEGTKWTEVLTGIIMYLTFGIIPRMCIYKMRTLQMKHACIEAISYI